MKPQIDQEGRFDGAILVDERGYRTLEGVEDFFHNGDRLVLVLRKSGHYVVQDLHKITPSWSSATCWDDRTPSAVVSTLAEAERTARDLLK